MSNQVKLANGSEIVFSGDDDSEIQGLPLTEEEIAAFMFEDEGEEY